MDRLNITHQAKRKGFNLIEAAIVLGVVGLVVGGIWVGAAAMMESYKVNKTVNDVVSIAGNIQNLITIQNANSLPTAFNITISLRDAGIFPKDWKWQAGYLNHPFSRGGYNGRLNVTTYPDPNPRFIIWLTNLPKSACIKMASRFNAMKTVASGTVLSIDFQTVDAQSDSECTEDGRLIISFPFTRVRN